MVSSEKQYQTFNEFYPFYLSQHSKPTTRALHYVGSILVVITLVISLISKDYGLLFLLPLLGYGFAWVGHFFIEKNKPATFTYPWYSFLADWVMLKDFLTGQLTNKLK